jgi:hypothetical protein
VKYTKHIEYIILSVILLVAVLVRLYNINSPLADWHSWRQSDTAAVSRIYADEGISILYPRYYDISTIQTGIFNPNGYRFVEFPLFNIIHVTFYKTFGEFSLEAWGRLTSVLAALGSTLFLFLIGRHYMGYFGGLGAAFYYAILPYNIFFTRVILPEPLAVFLSLGSLWFFIRFIDKENYINVYLSAVFFALAVLVKPFSVFYSLPMIYLILKKYSLKDIIRNYKLLIALDIALIPFFAWRIWINKFPEGTPHIMWMFNGDGIRFRPAFFRWIFVERLGRMILGTWGLIPFALGVISLKKQQQFINWFMAGMVLYMTVVASANVRHDYYQTFIIPAVCLLLSKGSLYMLNPGGLNKVLSRLVLIFSVLMMFMIGAYQVREFYKINHPEIILAGDAVDRLTPKDALVIAPYNGDTAFLYQTKRFGWPFMDRSIDQLIDRGADYYVSVNYDEVTNQLMEEYEVIEATDKYVIIKL